MRTITSQPKVETSPDILQMETLFYFGTGYPDIEYGVRHKDRYDTENREDGHQKEGS